VALSWNAALDCDGRAVPGYNLYRRASTEESYSLLNSTPITALRYTDTVTAALTAGEIFYYVVSAVDADGDESVKSEPRLPTSAQPSATMAGGAGNDTGDGSSGGDGGGTGSASGGGGCFISSATLCRGLGCVDLCFGDHANLQLQSGEASNSGTKERAARKERCAEECPASGVT